MIPRRGGRERVIPLSPELDAALRAYRARTAESSLRTGSRWLYSLPSGKPVYDGLIRERFRKCIEEAGLSSTGDFHSARHSFASHLLGEGAPITMVRDLLGHAKLTTTNIYSLNVTDPRAIGGRLDSASPRKQEEAKDGEVV